MRHTTIRNPLIALLPVDGAPPESAALTQQRRSSLEDR
jgi:hypothetical protein